MQPHMKQMFQRFGPVNGQIQTHRGDREAPCRRGIWAFPRLGHIRSDFYMVSHIFCGEMPKRLKNWNFEDRDSYGAYQVEYDAWFKKIRKIRKFRWSTIILDLDQELYTRLPPTWHPAHKDPTAMFTEDWYKTDVRDLWDRMLFRSVYWSTCPYVGKGFKDTFGPGMSSSQCGLYEVFIPM